MQNRHGTGVGFDGWEVSRRGGSCYWICAPDVVSRAMGISLKAPQGV